MSRYARTDWARGLGRHAARRLLRSRRRRVAVVALLCLVGAATVAGVLVTRQPEEQRRLDGARLPESTVRITPARTLLVRAGAPAGGDGSSRRPFADIQDGLDAARAGDVVSIARGSYLGPVTTVRSGEPGAPITIAGQPGAVLRGRAVDRDRALTVAHSWIVVSGLEITRADKGIWLQQATRVVIRGNYVHDLGGECIRMKYFSRRNEVVDNRIGPCGLVNFNLAMGRKNGEGVYLGTAPEQLRRNPVHTPDDTGQNWVHGNRINTHAECVDIKEGAEGNLVERNRCTGSLDPEGSGLDSRGNRNTIRYNIVDGVRGKGVRLGGDTADQGIDNLVYSNVLTRTGSQAVGVMRRPQRLICGNTFFANGGGGSNVFGVDPAVACPRPAPRIQEVP